MIHALGIVARAQESFELRVKHLFLVGLLLVIGRDADLAPAHRIERGFSRQIGVLDYPQTSGLVELRGQLARDHRDRK